MHAYLCACTGDQDRASSRTTHTTVAPGTGGLLEAGRLVLRCWRPFNRLSLALSLGRYRVSVVQLRRCLEANECGMQVPQVEFVEIPEHIRLLHALVNQTIMSRYLLPPAFSLT